MNDPAEVRTWARANGRTVSERGKIAADVIAEYEAAHPLSEQDDGDTAPVITLELPPHEGEAVVPAAEEVPPPIPRRPETPPRPPRRSRLRDRLAKPDDKRRRVSVESLTSWVWGLGGMALQQAPQSTPVGRMLAMQAPVAGVVVDDLVKGTIVDRILQPLARSSEKAEKAFALLGPPVLVGMISANPGLFPALAGPLKVAMLSWAEISEPAMRQAERKAQAMADRLGEIDVDAMIAALFADVIATPNEQEEAAIRRARGDNG